MRVDLSTDAFPLSPETLLLVAFLRQALADLHPRAAPADLAASRAFFSNRDGAFEGVCAVLDLDYEHAQALVARAYPEGQ
jgi:hypothetical protein